MEFMSRNAATPQPTPQGPTQSQKATRKPRHFDWNGRAVRIEWFIFTCLVAVILLLTIGWSIFTGYSNKGEFDKVIKNKYQALFLNGGSTSGSVDYTNYFGRITKITDNYVILKDVYYLTTSTSSDGKTVTPQLTKLGCQQLHSPYDEMVINRNQIAFWENLQDDGKLVTAINDYIKQNPNGPDCTATTTSTTPSTTSTQTSATTKTTP